MKIALPVRLRWLHRSCARCSTGASRGCAPSDAGGTPGSRRRRGGSAGSGGPAGRQRGRQLRRRRTSGGSAGAAGTGGTSDGHAGGTVPTGGVAGATGGGATRARRRDRGRRARRRRAAARAAAARPAPPAATGAAGAAAPAARAAAAARRAAAGAGAGDSYVSGVTVTVSTKVEHDPGRHLDAGEGRGPDVPRIQLRGQQRDDLARGSRARRARTATSCWAFPDPRRSRCASSAAWAGPTTRRRTTWERRAPFRAACRSRRCRCTTPRAASPDRWMVGAVENSPNTCTNDSCYFHSTWWLYILDRQGRVVWYYADGTSTDVSSFPQIARDGEYLFVEKRNFSTQRHAVGPEDDARSRDLQHVGDGARPVRRRRHDHRRHAALRHRGAHAPQLRAAPDDEGRNRHAPSGSAATLGRSTTATRTSSAGTRRRTRVLLSFPEANTIAQIDRKAGHAGRDVRVDDGQLRVLAVALELRLAALREHLAAGDAAGVDAPAPVHEGQRGRAEPARVRGVHDRSHEQAADANVWIYGDTASDGPEWAASRGEAVRLKNGNTLVNYGTGGVIREVTPGEEDRLLREVRHHVVERLLQQARRPQLPDRRSLRAQRRRAEVTATSAWYCSVARRWRRRGGVLERRLVAQRHGRWRRRTAAAAAAGTPARGTGGTSGRRQRRGQQRRRLRERGRRAASAEWRPRTRPTYDGTAEFYIIGEAGLGGDVCVVRSTSSARARRRRTAWIRRPAPPAAGRTRSRSATRRSSPTSDGACDASDSVPAARRRRAAPRSQRPAIGRGFSKVAGHGDSLMKYDGTKWTVVGRASWDETTGAFGYNIITGDCNYGR